MAKVPKKIKKYTRTVTKNGKKVRMFKWVKNPSFKPDMSVKSWFSQRDKNKSDRNLNIDRIDDTKIKGLHNRVTVGNVKYKRSQLLWEARQYGESYVKKKYGSRVFNKEKGNIEFQTTSNGRAGASASSKGKRVKVRMGEGYAKRRIGNSQANTIRNVDDDDNIIRGQVRKPFKEGGRTAPVAAESAAAPPEVQKFFNLENSENKRDGQHTPWAQTTAVSALINGLLEAPTKNTSDYWNQWATNHGGSVSLAGRPAGMQGADATFSQKPITNGSASDMATSNPMGAFGTNSTFEADQDEAAGEGKTGSSDLPEGYDSYGSSLEEKKLPANGVYNPWSAGQGGEFNQYGPNKQQLAQSQLEAMSLANTYFNNKRLHLAEQLGDMETDMRRLAVNLGRQVDDPVLQAKMYKEAMSATRALEIESDTAAFSLADQRRKEEIANFQFYDQMAQEEYKTWLANRHFYENLDLSKRSFNLQRWQVENAPGYGINNPQGSTISAGAPGSTAGAPPAQGGPSGEKDVYGNITGWGR